MILLTLSSHWHAITISLTPFIRARASSRQGEVELITRYPAHLKARDGNDYHTSYVWSVFISFINSNSMYKPILSTDILNLYWSSLLRNM